MTTTGFDSAASARPVALGDDSVLPFQLDRLALRGRVARLDGVLDRILTQHAYPPSVAALVGEAALLTALIGDAMKLQGRFSLQARGEGPVTLVATDYFAPGFEGLGVQEGAAGPEAADAAHIRAYATFDAARTPETSKDPAALLGDGLFAMTIDQGGHMRPYQGLTPIVPGGLGASAEAYFAQSEQLATRFVAAIGASIDGAVDPETGAARPHWRAGGVMLQHMGKVGEGAIGDQPSGEGGLMNAQDVADMSDSPDDWRHGALLLETADVMELIGPHVSPEALLFRLFHEVGPRVFPARPIRFGCTCSREKVVELLRSYPAENLADMRTEDGDVEAQCQFCGARYRWSPEA